MKLAQKIMDSMALLIFACVLIILGLLVHYTTELSDQVRQLERQLEAVEGWIVDEMNVDETWPGAQNVLHLSNGLWTGSGWPIQCEEIPGGYRTLVVTAKHVAEDDPNIPQHVRDLYLKPWEASAIGGKLQGGRVVSTHPWEDIAVMEFYSHHPVECLPWAPLDPPYGARVALSGYPLGDENLRTSEGLECHDGYATVHGAPGCSGGPIFAQDGTVFGIVVAGLGNGFDFITFSCMYVPLADVEDWLRDQL